MKRVLIVEDQADIRELVRMTLELEDLDIHEADNGDTAMSLASASPPDLMLLDVMMPGSLDGYQVCERIKRDPRLKKIKVVMLTARSQSSDRQAGRQAGADGYLTKPFRPRELLTVVNSMLR